MNRKIFDDYIVDVYTKFMESDINSASLVFDEAVKEYNMEARYLKELIGKYAKTQDEVAYKEKRLKSRALMRNSVNTIISFKSDLENNLVPNFSLLDNPKTIIRQIENYEKAFPEDRDFVKQLLIAYKNSLEPIIIEEQEINIFEEFSREINDTSKTRKTYMNHAYYKGEVEQARELIKEVLLSGYSIEDFCHLNLKYNLFDVRNAVKVASNKNTRLCVAINTELSKRKTTISLQVIDDITKQLNNRNSSFDVVDYFMNTRLSPQDMVTISLENLGFVNNNLEYFAKECKSKYLLSAYNHARKIAKSSEISGKTIKKGYEIDSEIKEKTIDFMEDKIVLYISIYNLMINKLIEGQVIEDKITGETLSIDLQKLKKIDL